MTSIGPLEPVLRFPRRSFYWRTGEQLREAPPPWRSRRPGHIPSRSELQGLFEEVLGELASHLQGLRQALWQALRGHSHTVVFPEGGSLLLPAWFWDRMHALGVAVVFLDPGAEVPEVLSDLLSPER